MRRFKAKFLIAISLFLLLALFGFWGTAPAESDNRLGFSVDSIPTPSGGLNAAALRFDMGTTQIDGMVGFMSLSSPSISSIGIGGQYLFLIHDEKPMDLKFVGRVTFGNESGGGTTDSMVAVGIGLAAEYFVAKNFSLELTGLLGFTNETIGSTSVTSFGFTGNGFAPLNL